MGAGCLCRGHALLSSHLGPLWVVHGMELLVIVRLLPNCPLLFFPGPVDAPVVGNEELSGFGQTQEQVGHFEYQYIP